MSYLRQGAVGLARAALGVDRAPEATIRARRQRCRACPDKVGRLCTACGCLIAAKTLVYSQSCPRGRW